MSTHVSQAASRLQARRVRRRLPQIAATPSSIAPLSSERVMPQVEPEQGIQAA